jgi:flagellar hook assembly protein FlgD
VWDVYNNSSDASISFVVASSAELALDKIFNYPNPFKEYTTFSFEFNRPSTELDVRISIYNMSGQLITTIDETLFTNGYRSNTIRWDGTTKGGWKITTGNYIYDIRVTDPGGETIHKASRLVVIR